MQYKISLMTIDEIKVRINSIDGLIKTMVDNEELHPVDIKKKAKRLLLEKGKLLFELKMGKVSH